MMYPKCCILKKFKDFPEAIDYMDAYLARAEVNHPTIESLNGWYVYPWSANWQNTVINAKIEVENYEGNQADQ